MTTSDVRFVYDQADHVSAWVNERVGRSGVSDSIATIGCEKDGRLYAGAVYASYFEGSDITMTLAVDLQGFGMGGRSIVREFFAYPFHQLRLPRVSCQVTASNVHCLDFVTGLGFHIEGRKPRAGQRGEDLILLGLFPENLRFVRKGFHHGLVSKPTTSSRSVCNSRSEPARQHSNGHC